VVVEPGSGWPGDPADHTTPVAVNPQDVVRLAGNAPSMHRLDARVSVCRACPRLVTWREQVAEAKRAAFADETYWGRPITGWGPERARIAIVGLAPAAHGGNRTGRVFTGDRSGDWLFAALHRAGLARQPTSTHADDGQQLIDVRMLAAVRCAPPANKPTPEERDTCRPWLERELAFLRPNLRVVVALGNFAWTTLWPVLAAVGYDVPARRPRFGHGVEAATDDGLLVIGSYHPSQQNTFTGKLTVTMLDAVFVRVCEAAEAGVTS
jgi:uracil-DNA glycosylase family 4